LCFGLLKILFSRHPKDERAIFQIEKLIEPSQYTRDNNFETEKQSLAS